MNAPPPLLADCESALYVIPQFLVFWNSVIAPISIIGGWHCLSKRFRREETMFTDEDIVQLQPGRI